MQVLYSEINLIGGLKNKNDADHEALGTNPALAFAVHRRALVRRIGLLTSRGWAEHIVDRWRDAVSNRPSAPYH